MPTRRIAIALVCFVFALVMGAYRYEPPVRNVILAFGSGLAVGASLFAFAMGIASVASERMQRHIAEQMLRNSPFLRGGHPTRIVPPTGKTDVSIFIGSTEEVIKQSLR